MSALYGPALVASMLLMSYTAPLPNDPLWPDQWYAEQIGVAEVWDADAGAGVTVAVVDSGVDLDHPDLQAKYLPVGWNVANNTDDVSPVYIHGTLLSGIVAAMADNALGMAGLAPGANILPVRVTNDPRGYAYVSDIAAGIRYAADMGARVVVVGFSITKGYRDIEEAAFYLRSLGGLLVAPAGNHGDDAGYSCDHYPDSPNIITVAATDADDKPANFSSCGEYVDLAAPGVGILTTTPGGHYGYFHGTSVSAPVVAAVLAALISLRPDLPPDIIEDALLWGAHWPDEWDESYGVGVVDLPASIRELQRYEVLRVTRDLYPIFVMDVVEE